jgi:hypothetical protein
MFFFVCFFFVKKKYTTSPNHNTARLGYGQLGPSFLQFRADVPAGVPKEGTAARP